MHRLYSGASENSMVGVVCGSKIKMRSSYNKILQGLHCGRSSVKSWLKMNSVGSKTCPVPVAEGIFFAPGHWTSGWQDENMKNEYTCIITAPREHLTFLFSLCYSPAFSLVGKEVEWNVWRLKMKVSWFRNLHDHLLCPSYCDTHFPIARKYWQQQ